MTTRITQNYASNTMVNQVLKNRAEVNKYSNEISSGLKVTNPGETKQAGTISQFQEMLSRIEGYKSRIGVGTSMLSFQDGVLEQANDIIGRAKEIGTQAANESNSSITRQQMAAEIFQLRDQMVNLANSSYQGRFIFGGADDDDPPFDAATYATPATGLSSVRYAFDAENGTGTQRSIQISDDVSMTVTTGAGQLFSNTIDALERMGRALEGFSTNPATGTPDGTGTAYAFPDDFSTQTLAIQDTLNLLEQARTGDIMPERVSIGARVKRLQTAESLLSLNKTSAEQVLDKLQNADVVESASKLSIAQTAFEASLQVTLRALNLSILNFL